MTADHQPNKITSGNFSVLLLLFCSIGKTVTKDDYKHTKFKLGAFIKSKSNARNFWSTVNLL